MGHVMAKTAKVSAFTKINSIATGRAVERRSATLKTVLHLMWFFKSPIPFDV